jgi:hypothetical protein
MDVGKSFVYVFEDKKWFEKLLIGAVVAVIPIVNLALGGYGNEIIRRVTGRSTEPLADWGDFGQKFVEGLLIAVAGLVYGLPALLFGIPLIPLIIGAATQVENQQGIAWLLGGASLGLTCLLGLYALLFSFVFPAIQVNYARKRTFSAAFYLREVFRLIRDNLGGYILAWLAYFVFALVAGAVLGFISTVLGWIPCVGWILALAATALLTPLVLVVYAHLFGQVGGETAVVVAEVPPAA